jgi:hypothetical protein
MVVTGRRRLDNPGQQIDFSMSRPDRVPAFSANVSEG